jgi:hypothetical protein
MICLTLLSLQQLQARPGPVSGRTEFSARNLPQRQQAVAATQKKLFSRDFLTDRSELMKSMQQARARGQSLASLTPDLMLDTTINYVPTAASQYCASVAFDGTDYFAVWMDYRTPMPSVYGTRIDAAGNVLNITGIQVVQCANYYACPDVVFNGTDYLVVWCDMAYSYDTAYVRAARVSPQGCLLDSTPIAIASVPYGWCDLPAAASKGSEFLVVWTDYRNGSESGDIYGALLTRTGKVLNPNGRAISTADGLQYEPSVAVNGNQYFVAWSDQRNGTEAQDIYGSRLNSEGVVLDTNGIAVSTADNCQGAPAVASDGTTYFIVWDDTRTGYEADIYGARVAPDGQVFDPSGIVLSSAGMDQRHPSIAFDLPNYVVVWDDARDPMSVVYGTRLVPDGTVLDPDGFSVSSSGGYYYPLPVIAAGDDNLLVVWADMRDLTSYAVRVYGARLSHDGIVEDPSGLCLAFEVAAQGYTACASDGTNYLVVWDDMGTISDIHATRVSARGEVLDPGGIDICSDSVTQWYPSVSFDGTNYVVVWTNYDLRNYCYDIYAARVSPAGEVLDPGGVAVTSNHQAAMAVVASSGTNSLVLWSDYRSGYWPTVYGARLNSAGKVLDPDGIVMYDDTMPRAYPSVTFGGENYFVAWTDGRRSSSEADLYGARVTPEGVVLDPASIRINAQFSDQWLSSVAFDGTNYLAAWNDVSPAGNYGIRGARVSQSGTVLDPSGISIIDWCGYMLYPVWPGLAFDGTNYLAAAGSAAYDPDYDVYGAKLSPAGIVTDSFPISAQPGMQLLPAVTCNSQGQSLVSYNGWAGEVNGKTYNSMRTWGRLGPIDGVAEMGLSLEKPGSALQVSPNPVRALVRVSYSLPKAGKVSVKLYDACGRLARTFEAGLRPAGSSRVSVQVADLPRGIYLLRLDTDKATTVQKLILE